MRRLNELLSLEDVPEHRREGCTKYQECLDIAVHGRYTSWSCAGCEDYDPCDVIVERFPEPITMPPPTEGIDFNKTNKQLLTKMREMGIPTRGSGPGNSEWRERHGLD